MNDNCARSKGQGHAQEIYAVKHLALVTLRVGDSKNVIVFNPLLTGHVIRRMRSGRVRIFNGNQWETLSLISQEWIGVGASNLVARLGT